MGRKPIISVFALLVLFLSLAFFEKLEFSVSFNRYNLFLSGMEFGCKSGKFKEPMFNLGVICSLANYS